MSVYNEYKQAKTFTRQRLYIETMESVLHEMNKVVVDEDVKGIVPFLPLGELNKKPASSDASQQ